MLCERNQCILTLKSVPIFLKNCGRLYGLSIKLTEPFNDLGAVRKFCSRL